MMTPKEASDLANALMDTPAAKHMVKRICEVINDSLDTVDGRAISIHLLACAWMTSRKTLTDDQWAHAVRMATEARAK